MSTDTPPPANALTPFFNDTKGTIDHVEEMLSTGRVAAAHHTIRAFREKWKDALWNGKSLPPGG